jgi:inosine-uridine nucleoside N-ribohydrolase
MATLRHRRLTHLALFWGVTIGCTLTCSSSKDVPTPVATYRIILDSDPAGMIATGFDVDDDLAILIALSLNQTYPQQALQPLLHIIGLTITAGNTQLRQAYADAVELVRHRCGIPLAQLPILTGAPWWPPPWERHPGKVEDTYGGVTEASSFIVDTVMNYPPRSVTILCLGPLTNIAAAMLQDPRIVDRLQRLVIMGGIIKPNRALDFNFRFDRSAASFVLKMPVPKLIIPVETAVQAIFGSSQLDRVWKRCKTVELGITERQNDEPTPAVCSLLLRLAMQRRIMPWFVNPQYKDILPHSEQYDDGFILWDVVALFALVHPEIFHKWRQYDVSFSSDLTGVNLSGAKQGALKMKLSSATEEITTGVNPTDLVAPPYWAESGTDAVREIESNRATIPLALNETALIEYLLAHLLKPSRPDDVVSCPMKDEELAHEPRLTFLVSLGLLPHLFIGLLLIVGLSFWSYVLVSRLLYV